MLRICGSWKRWLNGEMRARSEILGRAKWRGRRSKVVVHTKAELLQILQKKVLAKHKQRDKSTKTIPATKRTVVIDS